MIKLDTERLIIYTSSREEMEKTIDDETDDILKMAYQEMLQGSLTHPDQWEWYAIWMIERKDGTKIGDLCFKGLNDDGSVEIGYGILEAYQNRGYATEAVGAAVSWALCQPGVTRVDAETEPDNKASGRVLEKCGFIPTGTTGEEGPRFVRYRDLCV
ncbi:MAG: GNAT family N-acetyltransferase [Firmicutes bacterium]|nr:GNAT family N-acetyltransferase [Bacillota bacterium]